MINYTSTKEQTDPAAGDPGDLEASRTASDSSSSGDSRSNMEVEGSNSPCNDDDSIPTARLLSFWDSVLLITTWSTSGSIIIIPWAFGQLGYIVGPLVLVLWVLVTLYFNNFLLDVAHSTSSKTLGDVGYQLGGKRAKVLFQAFQIGNAFLYLPVALETVAISMQYLFKYPFGHGGCLGWWNIIAFGALFLLLQVVRTWKHVAMLAYLTVAIAAVKAFGLLPYVFVEYQDEIVASDEYMGPVLPAGNPENNWHDLALAVSSFAFAFTPIFLLVEVQHESKNPETCKRALAVSSLLQVSFYLISGLVCVALWGWNVADPITTEIPRDSWVGPLVNLVVLLAVALDFLMSAKLVNDWFKARFLASWTDSIQTQFLSTLPICVLSLGLVLVIPDFSTLVGVVTGVFATGMNNWVTSLAWLWGDRKYPANRFMMLGGLFLGFALTAWSVAAPIYDIATTNFTSSHFFCAH